MINSTLVGSGTVNRRAWAYIFGVGCAAAALALFAGLVPAQTVPTTNSAQDPKPTFRADTNLVVIPVAVTDTLNRFVLGLQKADFHLFEDGVEQDVAHFSGEDAPLSVGLVF